MNSSLTLRRRQAAISCCCCKVAADFSWGRTYGVLADLDGDDLWPQVAVEEEENRILVTWCNYNGAVPGVHGKVMRELLAEGQSR